MVYMAFLHLRAGRSLVFLVRYSASMAFSVFYPPFRCPFGRGRARTDKGLPCSDLTAAYSIGSVHPRFLLVRASGDSISYFLSCQAAQRGEPGRCAHRHSAVVCHIHARGHNINGRTGPHWFRSFWALTRIALYFRRLTPGDCGRLRCAFGPYRGSSH